MTTGVPDLPEILAASLFLAVASGLLGYRLAARLLPDLDSLLLAPAVGLALYLALALPASLALDPGWGAGVALAVAATASIVLPAVRRPPPGIGMAAFGLAAASLAALVAATITPHVTPDAIMVGDPLLDHGKVALIDEMVRSGVPPANPFVGPAETRPFVYYYLWFLPAAQLRLLGGVSGWGADIAMTWLTAIASIGIVGALANRLAGRTAAMWLTLPILLTGRLRESIQEHFPGFLGGRHGLEPWLIQAAWVPQHMIAAGLVVLTVFALWRLIGLDRRDPVVASGTGMMASVAFGCSTWVGGVALLLILLPFAAPILRTLRRQVFAGPAMTNLAVSALAALAVAFPLLLQQLGATGGSPFPIGLVHFAVFDPSGLGRYPPLELVGFWLVTLVVDLPGYYPAGVIALAAVLLAPGRHERLGAALPWLALAITPFLIAQFLRSVIAGNDLAWRSILVPQFVLAAAIAAALVRMLVEPRLRVVAVAGAITVLVGLPFGMRFLDTNVLQPRVTATPTPAQRDFRSAPDLWAAVRRHTPPTEAVLNNPLSLQHLTTTHGNLGWALLSDRRSCLSSTLWLLAFARMAPEQTLDALKLAERLFDGKASDGDERRLVEEFACRTIVVTPRDTLWSEQRLAIGSRWQMVEERPEAWRIYRLRAALPAQRRP